MGESQGAKIAVVTGANKGIGFEVSRQLAAEGHHVVLGCRDEARGREAASRIRETGFAATAFPLDVTSEESVARFRDLVEREFHRVDILVNNAGVALDKFVSALDLEVEVLRTTFDVNVMGAFMVSKSLIPLMKRAGGGRVVMVSSMLGSLESMGGLTLAYRMSKTALNAMTRVLAAELATSGILVNAVCPGWVRTDLGGPTAPVSPEAGAARIVELTQLPSGSATGKFFRDGVEHPW